MSNITFSQQKQAPIAGNLAPRKLQLRGKRPWLRKLTLGFVALLFAFTSVALVAGAAAKASLRTKYPPIGQMVDVGGYRMHIGCAGTGSPTVILEAGAGGLGLHWALVQPEVAKTTRVCAYDRAGLGWSDPSPRPRTADVMAAELAALLTNAKIDGPYILVGHSLGGPIIRQFAMAHPREVAGMVFVDSAHEQQLARFPAPIREASGQMFPMRLMKLAAGAGIFALKPSLLPLPHQLPREALEANQALIASSSKTLATFLDEVQALKQDAAPVTTLGDIPLVAIRHGRSEMQPDGAITPDVIQEYEATWTQLQQEQAALSPRGKVVVAEHSGHNIMLEQPELVIDAIREVIIAK